MNEELVKVYFRSPPDYLTMAMKKGISKFNILKKLRRRKCNIFL